MSSNSIQEADLYRKFIENVSCPIQINQMIYNEKGEPVDYRILDINHAGELQIAIKKENIIGRKVSDILPDTEPEWFVRYDEAVKTGKVLSFDMYGGPFDRTFNTLVIPLGDLRFAIMFRDITERRQEEKEKQILLEDLQKEKDRLTFLFNHIPEEIWFTDERGNIILTNKAVREKFRTVYPSINTAEIAGSPEIFRPDGSIRPLDEAPLLRAVKEEQIINGEEIIKIPDSNELRCRQFSAVPIYDVSDNGEGINPELMPKMFQPFMQGDNNSDRNREGLGLGLTIVKGMAELHGGNVEAFSEGPGKGMTFTVRLPITKGNIKEQKYCLNAENISDKSLKILIVEDNKSLAEMTCEYLKLFGHEAAAVHCGSDCILKANKMRPDVILCDIGLPDMSGYEVAMKIRKSAELKDTVLIAVSGYARSEDIKRSHEAGLDRHLAKPVYMDMLRMTLDKICE